MLLLTIGTHIALILYMMVASRSARQRGLGVISLVAASYLSAAWAQPTLELIGPQEAAHPGQPSRITVIVRWTGSPEAYRILPAKVAPVEWGQISVSEAVSTVKDGMNVVTQTITVIPARAGTFQIADILIPYRTPEDLTPPEADAPATDPTMPSVDPTLNGAPILLHVRPDRTLAWLSGGLGVLLLCILLGWWRVRKSRPSAGHPPLRHPADDSNDVLIEARKHRLDGHPYEYYLSLSRAASSWSAEARLVRLLRDRAQDVGYRGIRPTEEQMNADYDAVERVVRRLREERNA